MQTCFPPFHRRDIAVKATASLRTAELHADVLFAVSSARYCCQSDRGREPARVAELHAGMFTAAARGIHQKKAYHLLLFQTACPFVNFVIARARV